MTETLIERMVTRWSDPEARPLFRGKLIHWDGSCCAQGDVLRVCGVSDDSLRAMEQADADRRVARELGISIAHSVLLRQINDDQDDCPQDVLAHPERVLGPEAPRILAFWRHLDTLTQDQWAAARDAAMPAARASNKDANNDAARAAARDDAVWATTRDAINDATWNQWAVARDTAWAAVWATHEVRSASKLEKFYFLPLFGIDDPTKLAPISAL